MARYIDADKLYTRVKEKTNPYGKPTLDYESGVKVLDMIKEAPTADVVEVKYGYWEIVKGSNGKEKMVCTNCRHQQDLHSTFTYCPNCGALIDGRVIHNG